MTCSAFCTPPPWRRRRTSRGASCCPPNLRQHAKLEKDVTVIGVGRHAEIWNTQAWQQMNERLRSGPIAAAMEELEF